MTRFAIGLLATTLSAAQPSADDLATALANAKAAWGVTVAEPIHIMLAPLNSCDRHGKTPEIANIRVVEKVTTVAFDDGSKPVTSTAYEYDILINSACRWESLNLQNTVSHEMGHVLLGAKYHSADRHSIMFPIVGGKQRITQADRLLVVTQ